MSQIKVAFRETPWNFSKVEYNEGIEEFSAISNRRRSTLIDGYEDLYLSIRPPVRFFLVDGSPASRRLFEQPFDKVIRQFNAETELLSKGRAKLAVSVHLEIYRSKYERTMTLWIRPTKEKRPVTATPYDSCLKTQQRLLATRSACVGKPMALEVRRAPQRTKLEHPRMSQTLQRIIHGKSRCSPHATLRVCPHPAAPSCRRKQSTHHLSAETESQRRDGRFVRANFWRIRISAGSGCRAAQEVEAVTLCSPQRRALAPTSIFISRRSIL